MADPNEMDATRLGELLETAGDEYYVTLIGGAALSLHGWVERTTDDANILTFASGTIPPTLSEAPDPLPASLREAVAQVARDLGLKSIWLNRGPARQWKTGLPPDFAARIEWRRYGGLRVGLAARRDLIAFKLFAEIDRGNLTGQGLDHMDLVQLDPSDEELHWAAQWVRTQDAGPEFPAMLERVIENVQRARR